MSFNDPFYLRYLAVVGAIIGVAGAVLVIMRKFGLKENRAVAHAWKAYLSWLPMAAIIFAVTGFGKGAFTAGVAVLSVFCVREFSQATGLAKDRWFMSTVYAFVALIHFTAYIGWYGLFIIMPVFAVAVLFLLPVFRNETAGMVQKIGLGAIAAIYMGWFPGHLSFMSNHPQWAAYVLFLLLGVVLNDMSGFIFGSAFGRHLLIPNVSPKKSVEGTLGAMAVVVGYILAAKAWLPGFTTPMLAYSFIIIAICGTLGDLVISVIKRDAGVKDMGTLIPGHGGILDRADSLLIAAPLFFHLVRYMVGFPGLPKILQVAF
jgi:phosphatidate cytidylyltransferase